jgi:hypothetical protein
MKIDCWEVLQYGEGNALTYSICLREVKVTTMSVCPFIQVELTV